MYDIVSRYIEKLSVNDVKDFFHKNAIELSDEEADFAYLFVKKNWQEIISDPNILDMRRIENKFTSDNYPKVCKLVDYYRMHYINLIKK